MPSFSWDLKEKWRLTRQPEQRALSCPSSSAACWPHVGLGNLKPGAPYWPEFTSEAVRTSEILTSAQRAHLMGARRKPMQEHIPVRGLKKKGKRKKIQIINNWWEQSKNYRTPAIWSDHFRSAQAIGGNWILKTSFIVDQLLCFKYLREESDFLQALDSCLREHLTLIQVTLWTCLGGLWPLAAWKGLCDSLVLRYHLRVQQFNSDTTFLEVVSDP